MTFFWKNLDCKKSVFQSFWCDLTTYQH